MLKSLKELSERLVSTVQTFEPNENWPNQTAASYIENELMWYLDDVFKCINNINETSLNSSDRAKRLIELEEKFGIPKTHNIFK